ncbi:protein aardvark [Anaeramoeba ignava]|uniref:Protein aardvark n=1 Tax=Anaeramoeba ignava TaxID=1746090 RepID=A0A9Q0LVY7_ANAIG|nr:protein aardvark [Anaeramoeba ignava]
MKLGGIRLILEPMNKFPNNQEILVNGLVNFGNLAYLSEEYANEITYLGGIELTIELMKKFSTNEEIILFGLSTLQGVSFKNFQNIEKIRKLGGIELIIKGMKDFPTNEAIQGYGGFTLGNLGNDEENRNQILELGGTKISINSLKNFPNDSHIQQSGILALTNLAYKEENRIEIANLKGIELIIKAMNNFPIDQNIQYYGCGALFHLSSSLNEANKIEIRTQKGIETMIKAMDNYPNELEIQRFGMLAILNISVQDEKLDVWVQRIKNLKKEKLKQKPNDIWGFNIKMFPSNIFNAFQKIEMEPIELKLQDEFEAQFQNENEIQIKQICSSNRLKNFLFQNGELFDQLNPKFLDHKNQQENEKPKKIEINIGNKDRNEDINEIKKVTAGGYIESILTFKGEAFAKGKEINSENPNQFINISSLIEDTNDRIIQDIVCGKDSIYLLTSNHNAYGIGSNEFGQLGFDYFKLKRTEKPILMMKNVSKIFSGSSSEGVFLLNSNQELFGCGANNFGQLGLGVREVTNITKPLKVQNIPNGNIIDIQIGIFHSIMLIEDEDKNRKIYSCGNYMCNGLGQKTRKTIRQFTELKYPLFENDRIEQISVGRYHTLILTKNGKLIGFGESEKNEIKRPTNQFQFTLFYIEIPEILYDISNYHIYCGNESSFLYSNFYSTLEEDLIKLFRRKEFCDISFKTKNGEIIEAHKLIIYFRIGNRFEEFEKIISQKSNEEAHQIFELIYGNNNIESYRLKEEIQDKFNLYESIAVEMEDMYHDERSKDFTIERNGKEIKFHKLILIARSELFREMFSTITNDNSNKVIDYSGLSDKVFEIMKYWIYTNQINEGVVIQKETINEIDKAIDYFRLNPSHPNLFDLSNELYDELFGIKTQMK